MKILDRYIILKFLSTFFYAMMLLIAVSIVIDISEKMDDFIDNAAPLKLIVFEYYLNFIPYIGILLSPLFIFIAVIFFTSRMAYRSEIIAILNSGISFNRLLLPYFLSAAVLSSLMLYASHIWVPNANKTLIAFENTYIKDPFMNQSHNIHIQNDPTTYLYLENYNNSDSVGYKFAMEVIKDGQLVRKLRGERIKWNREKNMWRITNFYERTNLQMIEKIRKGRILDTTFNLRPEDLERRQNIKETMTTPELAAFIDDERAKGIGNLAIFEVEKQKRTAIPISTYILTFMGLAIASRKVRGGMGYHIAIGISISAAYVFFMQISSTLSINIGLSAILGVWIPNIIFGIIAVVLLRYAQK